MNKKELEELRVLTDEVVAEMVRGQIRMFQRRVALCFLNRFCLVQLIKVGRMMKK